MLYNSDKLQVPNVTDNTKIKFRDIGRLVWMFIFSRYLAYLNRQRADIPNLKTHVIQKETEQFNDCRFKTGFTGTPVIMKK